LYGNDLFDGYFNHFYDFGNEKTKMVATVEESCNKLGIILCGEVV
jgi:hypothetical protein